MSDGLDDALADAESAAQRYEVVIRRYRRAATPSGRTDVAIAADLLMQAMGVVTDLMEED